MMVWDVHLPKTTEFVQIVLDFLGYNPGPVNGTLGQQTRVAIRAFQQHVGLQEDGEISPALVNHLYTAVLRKATPSTR
jgi:peptidoglycan hydrolase-like protein with peptidoglycan-binding domain